MFSSHGPSRDQGEGSCSTPQPAHKSHTAPRGRNAHAAAVVHPFGHYWCQGKQSSMTESLFLLVPGPQLSRAEPVLSSRLNPCLKLQAVWSSPLHTPLCSCPSVPLCNMEEKKNHFKKRNVFSKAPCVLR